VKVRRAKEIIDRELVSRFTDWLYAKYRSWFEANEKDQTDSLMDAKQMRLSSAPMQALKLAMIFETTRWAKNANSPLFGRDGQWRGIIEERTLNDAIEHIKACLEAADFLDSIASKAEIATEAEILLA
jgi:hypothetical protein